MLLIDMHTPQILNMDHISEILIEPYGKKWMIAAKMTDGSGKVNLGEYTNMTNAESEIFNIAAAYKGDKRVYFISQEI